MGQLPVRFRRAADVSWPARWLSTSGGLTRAVLSGTAAGVFPLVKLPRILGRFHSAAQTLPTSEAGIELKGGRLGRLLEPLKASAMRRMAPNSLVASKYYWVKNGRPYGGRHSTLPRAAVSC